MKTITYDETKFQLLPISLDSNMLEAAANAELLANRNHGEPASISDIWDALRSAAPQPECVERTTTPELVGWVLFDVENRFIKMDPDDGMLAIFDNEAAAQKAKQRYPGTDYVRREFFTSPAPGPQPAAHIFPRDLKSLKERGHCMYTIYSEPRHDPHDGDTVALYSAAQEPSHDDK